jgi:hypothetical protein
MSELTKNLWEITNHWIQPMCANNDATEIRMDMAVGWDKALIMGAAARGATDAALDTTFTRRSKPSAPIKAVTDNASARIDNPTAARQLPSY